MNQDTVLDIGLHTYIMIQKLRLTSLVLAIISFIAGLLSLVWNVIYESHSWHHDIFRENHYVDGYMGAISVALCCLFVFLLLFLIGRKKMKGNIGKYVIYVTFVLYNLASIATIILTILYAVSNFNRDYNDMRLDNQLSSTDITLFYESVDTIIARSTNHDLYTSDSPNDYMMTAARSGYAPAQNYIGVYFHEQAKKKNDDYYGYLKWENNSSYYCQEELDRATYWWMKAAKQNHGRAQENLGRLKMHSLLSNQTCSLGDARFWLTQATKNGVTSAYYYLGMLCRDNSLQEAQRYWLIGANKGNEDCMKMLENPDFIDI